METFQKKVTASSHEGQLACDTSEYIQVFFVPKKNEKTGKISLDSNNFVTVQRITQTNSRTNPETQEVKQFQRFETKLNLTLEEQEDSFGEAWNCNISTDITKT